MPWKPVVSAGKGKKKNEKKKKRKKMTSLGRIRCRKTEMKRFWQLCGVGGAAAFGHPRGPSAHTDPTGGLETARGPRAEGTQHFWGTGHAESLQWGRVWGQAGTSRGSRWDLTGSQSQDPAGSRSSPHTQWGGHSLHSHSCPPTCPQFLPQTPLFQPFAPGPAGQAFAPASQGARFPQIT